MATVRSAPHHESVRLDRRLLLSIGVGAGLLLGRIGWSAPVGIVILVVAIACTTWVARGMLDGSNRKENAVAQLRRTRIETYWPPRCSHCGARGSSTLRMIAGRDAYICELCLRRGIELLDAPDDITRFR
jgi:hypothetical protein